MKSVGGTFVDLPLDSASAETAGGYARARGEAFHTRQRELLAGEVAAADIVIATAQVQGGRSPVLVTGDMVRAMRPGSVVLDAAAAQGGRPRVRHLHGQPHGIRQAQGHPARPPHGLPRPAGAESAVVRSRRGRRAPAGGLAGDDDAVPRADRPVGAVRDPAGGAHRGRRHADRHLAAQLVRRSVRRGDGLRPGQQGADHRGLLAAAREVIVVLGYGLAVAQAQHQVREVGEILERNGARVRYAIHPVAGRMPGHMNVLLAEADVPYDRIADMDDINGDFAQADVALVAGANDVTNPAARTRPDSPIYGMPLLDVAAARTVMVVKRGMSAGFAGVENELYHLDKTLMLFGDAKNVAGGLARELENTLRGQRV
ncbi:hypothetical protein B1L11_09750 [Microbispora sp. GKU 823]|nr:hypothetical protein B1L11_09750 [Microbispora sp. GKU 823]